MGKKGSWFSAIKKVFTQSSKDKVTDGSEKKSTKEKKKKGGRGKLKHGEGQSFIPLFREPSSIEKILGDAEREHQLINFRPLTPPEQPKEPPQVHPPGNATPSRASASPQAPTHPPEIQHPRNATSSRATSSPQVSNRQREVDHPRNAASSRATASSQAPAPLIEVEHSRNVTPAKALASSQAPTPQREALPPPSKVASDPWPDPLAKAAAPPSSSSPKFVPRPRPEPTLRYQHACATKIQAAYRGYMGRRNYRALRGLVRLQGVVKGQSVKRQTMNALRCMQLLVRVQTQIQSRRIQMLENQALQRQLYKSDNDRDSIFSKWNFGQADEWDDSTLPKEEIEARMQRKVEAVMKRERAMAYAYSNQLWKTTPKTAHGALMDIRSGGYPYWWSWLGEHQAPSTNPSDTRAFTSLHLTPPRPTTLDPKASPLPQLSPRFDNLDTPTPRSTKSHAPTRAKHLAMTPPSRLHIRSRPVGAHSPFNGSSFKDDDSLTSCPPFSAPRYMSPTVSAMAKVRENKEQTPSVTSDETKRRMSFPMGQGTGSQKGMGKAQSVQSVGNLSVDSTVSMPATVGRKPFNRFV